MSNEPEILDQARRCVSEEQSGLRTECDAFRAFRDTASRARPATAADTNGGTDTSQLLEGYRETVMSTPDFETTYGDSLAENLAAEFTPSISNTLISTEQITQQQKRDLLLATNRAIQQREELGAILETERESLQTIQNEMSDIKTTLEALPLCSIQRLSFDEYVEVWNTCNAQLERCDRLLRDRQAAVTEAHQPDIPRKNDAHAFNEYLYHSLETPYPALRTIAETLQRIEQYCGEEKAESLSEQRNRPAARR